MKNYFLLVLVWIYLPTFSQEVLRVNFKDSCIIRSVKLSRKDFLAMKRLCPPELSKVNSCIVSVTLGGQLKEFMLNEIWDPKLFKNVAPGNKIYFTNIKGNDATGKDGKAADIVISIN
jgi:hypothetical protein